MVKCIGLGWGIGVFILIVDQVECFVDVFFFGVSLWQIVVDEVVLVEELQLDIEVDIFDLEVVLGIYLIQVDLYLIVVNLCQFCIYFDLEDLVELVYSVCEFGVFQLVVVCKNVDGDYELIMGEWCIRVVCEVGFDVILVIVCEMVDEDLFCDVLFENLYCLELNFLEEVFVYQQLLEDFGIIQEELVICIGCFCLQISNMICFFKFLVLVQQWVVVGVFIVGYVCVIFSFEMLELMQCFVDKVVNEDLLVWVMEQVVKLLLLVGKIVKLMFGVWCVYFDEVVGKFGDCFNIWVKIVLGV